ncbi:hypothetical protein CH338_13495, partial [Rhodoplanes elegans]
MLDRTRGAAPTSHALARGLGWFSIALGVAEIVAPRAITRRIGLRGQESLVQAYGAREIATGIAYAKMLRQYPLFWYEEVGDPLD